MDQETPGPTYHPSSRKLPAQPSILTYPNHWETRKVAANSSMRWHKKAINVSDSCAGQYIGLEEIEIGVWNVYLGSLRIVDIYGHKMCKPCVGLLKGRFDGWE